MAAQGGIIFFDFHAARVVPFIFLSVVNVIAFGADQANPATVSLFLCHDFVCLQMRFLVHIVAESPRGVNTRIAKRQ